MSYLRRTRTFAGPVIGILGLAATVAGQVTLGGRQHAPAKNPHPAKATSAEAFSRLPLSFEPNRGQASGSARFLARGPGYTMSVSPTRLSLALRRKSGPGTAELGMKLAGANNQARLVAGTPMPGRVNYILGNDPKKWRINIPTFGEVRANGVYPGVDLVYYGNQHQLEYDFKVHPGADPSQIRLSYEGADRLEFDASGDLLVHKGGDALRQHRPRVYQQVNGKRVDVVASYVREGDSSVGFQLGQYDRSQALVIDPLIVYSAFLGGSSEDGASAVAVDTKGAAYVVGATKSANFPTANAYASQRGSAMDAFLSKINPAGTALVYSTYFGGSNYEHAYSVAVDAGGSAVVVGDTASPDFPSRFPFQQFHSTVSKTNHQDAFVTKFSATGSALVYSSALGGTDLDEATGVVVDGKGAAYVTGYTSSLDLPIVNGFQPTYGGGLYDGMLYKLHPQGNTILYCSYAGGADSDVLNGIATNGDGTVYLTGATSSVNFPTASPFAPAYAGGDSDAVVLHVDPTIIGAAGLLYSTYLGGAHSDVGRAIATDITGNAYVVGDTYSTGFPLVNAIQVGGPATGDNGFLTEFDPTGGTLVFSTLMGGTADDIAAAVGVDSQGSVYVSGATSSSDWPYTIGAPPVFKGTRDAFVVKVDPAAPAFDYVKYLGGAGDDAAQGLAVVGVDSAYVVGYTYSQEFKITAGTFKSGNSQRGAQPDGFIVKLGQNDPPVSQGLNISTLEDTLVKFNVLATDADGDPFQYILVSGPLHGTLTGTLPNLTYTPFLHYHGPDSFTYKTNDNTVDGNTATVNITVVHVNHAPVTAPSSVNAVEDTPLPITLNASDIDGDALVYTIVGPAHGTLSGTAPNLTYTPAANYNGPDSFTFKVSDGALTSNTSTVSIAVSAVNDAPVSQSQSVTTKEEVAKSITLVSTDVDGNPLLYTLVTGPLHGTLSALPGAPITGSATVTYTPDALYFGTDSFTFVTNDGTVDSNVATVSITITHVNHAPVANSQTVTLAEDSFADIVATGSDADGDAITYSQVSWPLHGTLTGVLPNVHYVADANFNGSDSFTFRVHDGTVFSALATVTLNVTPVNDAPTATGKSVTLDEDASLAISLNAADIDGDTLSYVLTQPTHGVFSGTAPNLTYIPFLHYHGPDSFTFYVNDGTVNSNVATINITVNHVNHAPTVVGESYTTQEDTPIVIGAPGLLANDSDIDGDPLSVALQTGPVHGQLVINADGSFSFQPAQDFNGTDTFTYRVSDGITTSALATVTLTVTSVNDAPVSLDQSVVTLEDKAANLVLHATDAEGDSLTYSIVSGPLHGTLSGTAPNVKYTPTPLYFGTDSFTFQTNDGALNSNVATVSITIVHVNHVPTAQGQTVTTAEDAPKAITLVASDLDGDSLAYTVVSGPSHGTLTGSLPNVTYTPAVNYNGTDSFTFKANDASSTSNTATVSIIITAVNDAPTALAKSVTTNENVPIDFSVAATDPEGDALTYFVVNQPSHGTLTGLAPNLTYTPDLYYYGPDSITFQANDGQYDSNVATVSITVTHVNQKPIADAQSVTTAEDVVKPITLTASDPDGDALTYLIITPPAHGKLTGNAPNLTYTPAVNYSGGDSFSFRARDGALLSDTALVTITVTAVNDAPVATNATVSTFENSSTAITLQATDVDSSNLTYSYSAPIHGTLQGTAPNLTYTPDTYYFGQDTITFTATDDAATPLTSNIAVITINVIHVNQAPTADDQAVTTDQNVFKLITLTGSDPDPNNPLTFSIVSPPSHGKLTGTPPNVKYTPTTNYYGTDSFRFRCSDGALFSSAGTVTITINHVNQAPVALSANYSWRINQHQTIRLRATDPDNDPLTITVVTPPTHGVLTPNGDGTYTYAPAKAYVGNDTFQFRANDGLLDSNLATVSIELFKPKPKKGGGGKKGP